MRDHCVGSVEAGVRKPIIMQQIHIEALIVFKAD